jgi:hypothetical protein
MERTNVKRNTQRETGAKKSRDSKRDVQMSSNILGKRKAENGVTELEDVVKNGSDGNSNENHDVMNQIEEEEKTQEEEEEEVPALIVLADNIITLGERILGVRRLIDETRVRAKINSVS